MNHHNRITVLVATTLVLLFASTAPTGDAAAQAAASPVPEGAQVEAIASGFQFTEGPHWDDASGTLLFSDIPANTIYQWHPEADSTSVYRRPSGNANGIVAGLEEGTLLLAQHGWRRVARVAANGQETALATHYEGQRLNSPNDVTVHSNGAVYFTDPPYGVEEGARELDFAGVYRVSPDGDDVTLLTREFARPNGIVFSPDESRLYVNDTRAGLIRVYDVSGETLSGGEVFARLEGDGAGAPDGMTVDTEGRVYSTGPGGLWVFAPSGELLDRIRVPERATNVTFGGAANQTLFITTPATVYRVRVKATGVR